MSWTFHLQKINQSFNQIAVWYTEFMRKTELCFQNLHARILRLESQQPTQGPTDEQVERVLRKILSERFSNPNTARVHDSPPVLNNEGYFLHRDRPVVPHPIHFDPASLLVEPDSVPSKAYSETFNMLEQRLADFPHNHPKYGSDEDDGVFNASFEPKTPRSMDAA